MNQGVPTAETEEARWGMREIFGGGIWMKSGPSFPLQRRAQSQSLQPSVFAIVSFSYVR